jgi:hypothetical protein
MNHDGLGLVKYGVPGRVQTEAQVDVFVVSGREALIKSTDCLIRRPADKQARRRAVVDLTSVIEGRIGWITAGSTVPCGAVVPHDAAGLL